MQCYALFYYFFSEKRFMCYFFVFFIRHFLERNALKCVNGWTRSGDSPDSVKTCQTKLACNFHSTAQNVWRQNAHAILF